MKESKCCIIEEWARQTKKGREGNERVESDEKKREKEEEKQILCSER